MISRDFIFSEKKSDRVKRHLLFWFCYWLYFTFFHAIGSSAPETQLFQKVLYPILEAFHMLIPQVFFTYVLIDFILPRYILKNRYVFSFFWIIVFLCATAVFSFILLNYVFANFTIGILPDKFRLSKPRTFNVNIVLARIGTIKGTVMVATAACSIRLIKYWHLKEKRSLELLKEKTEAQLQLLTAQVHPHFLFNTLKNIYSKTQYESSESAKMIMELSHILRYVLDEGKRALVNIESELQMITDYINLEKIRYDEKLDLHVSMPSNTENIYITPLLILPFVENCFKHGTSKMLVNPWINLKIELNDTTLFLTIMNGKKTPAGQQDDRKGTGIGNVRKRLELLYRNRYTLQINEDDEIFVVNLKMELVRIDQFEHIQTKKITSVSAYA
jgi:sensor histidine kinase YesM